MFTLATTLCVLCSTWCGVQNSNIECCYVTFFWDVHFSHFRILVPTDNSLAAAPPKLLLLVVAALQSAPPAATTAATNDDMREIVPMLGDFHPAYSPSALSLYCIRSPSPFNCCGGLWPLLWQMDQGYSSWICNLCATGDGFDLCCCLFACINL